MRIHRFWNPLRFGALALAASLVLTGFAACGGSGGSGAGKLGRYVEESLAEDLSITSPSAGRKDGAVTWFGEEDGRPVRFTQAYDPPHEAQPLVCFDALLQAGGSVSSLSEAPNGTLYAIYTDSDDQSGVAVSSDGQTAVLIPMEHWTALSMRSANGTQNRRISANNVQSAGGAAQSGGADSAGGPSLSAGPEEGGGPRVSISNGGAAVDPTSQKIPQRLVALDDGFLVSYMMQGVCQYDSAGKEVRSYEATVRNVMGFSESSGLAVYGNTMAWADTQAGEVLLFDLSSGEQSGTAAFDGLNGTAFLHIDADGPVVADSTGIFRWDGSDWNLIVDGSLTSLIMPNQVISALFCADEIWYAFLTVSGGTRLVQFRYDPEMPVQPDRELTIFSLYDNVTVRLAVCEFQRDNPDLRVTLEVGIETSANEEMRGPFRQGEAAPEPDNSATADDVIRALNTRLLAQNGPDLLVLDGLPLQSYIEKGVLKDISTLSKRLIAEDDLLANLSTAYRFNNKTYALPSRFSVPVMIGGSGSLHGIDSIAELVSAIEKHGNQEPALLKTPDQLWEDSGLLMYGYDASVANFTQPDGSLDEAALTAYLSDALALTTALREINPEANEGLTRRVAFAMGIGGSAREVDTGAMQIAEGEALLHLQVIDSSMDYAMIANQLGSLEDMHIEALFRKGYFMPVGGVGVVSSGKQQELAESFLKTLLGKTVQENYMVDALPVNRAAWTVMTEALEEQFAQLEAAQFSDMGFLSLCESLRTPLFVDEYVKSAVSSQAKSVVDGSLSPAEAAANIIADTRLYLAE